MLAEKSITGRILVVLAALIYAVSAAAQAPSEGPEGTGVSTAYLIGPGDNLQVFVWRNPELSVTVPVRPDGRITTPLVEEMVASGKTAAELARDMEEVLAEYIRSPHVNIIVTNPQSLMSEVRAIGQVETPQGVPYRDGMTALDLVLAVGGLAEFAAGNRASIVRKNGESEEKIKVRLHDLLNKGDLSQNIELMPGDILVVPESRF